DAGPVRAGLAARSQDELAVLAERAVALLPGLRPGRLAADGRAYAAEGGRGRVTLLFPGEPAAMAHPGPGPGDDASSDQPAQPAILARSLASLGWLTALGVTAQAATGHG